MCDNKIIHASNGIDYNICVPYTYMNLITGKTKIYAWPLEVKVLGGTLKRFVVNGAVGYTFISDLVIKNNGNGKKIVDMKSDKDYKGNGNSKNQIIEGVDNSILILAVAGFFLLS